MSFESRHAPRIWEDLYAVYAPDFVTLNSDYIRRFGVPSSGVKEVDKMMSTSLSYVRIPIIKILEYYENGVEVQIPSRPDMIMIHKHIEAYLTEWRDHLVYSININRTEHKTLLLSLERLSKLIFEKAHPREVLDHSLREKGFGLKSVTRTKTVEEEWKKPDYNSIGKLLKPDNSGRY